MEPSREMATTTPNNTPPFIIINSSSFSSSFFLVLSLFLFGPLLVCGRNIEADGAGLGVGGSWDSAKELKSAVFALGSFWHGEVVFGCLPGVVRTTVGYSGGAKLNPEYRNTGDHAESVQVEYDSKLVKYEQLLDVFWSSHDPTQVFGQGPDVGDQYRSIIFVQNDEEERLATIGKGREQTKLNSQVMTEIQKLGVFYPAEAEHQKFELRRKPLLMQLIRYLGEEGNTGSYLATKLNAYAAGLCYGRIQKVLDSEVASFQKALSRFHEVSLN